MPELLRAEAARLAARLLEAREADQAAAAWDDRMGLLWALLSIRNWEHLTIDRGWSTSQ